MSTDTTQSRRPGVTALLPALAILALLGAGCSDKESSAPQEAAQAPAAQVEEPMAQPPAEESTAPAEEPMSEPAAEEPAAAAEPTASVDGQKIYETYCKVCHAAGVANAPKLGDKEAWAPRIAKGTDAMFNSLQHGLNAMPPKGTCMACSDEELRAAMEYMVGQGS